MTEAVVMTPRAALEILIRLHALLKIAKFYEANNANFQEQLKILFEDLREYMESMEEVIIQVGPSAVSVNRMRIRFDYASFHVYKAIQSEILQRGVGVLTFRKGLERAELGRFIVLLARQDARIENPFEALLQETRRQGIERIVLDATTEGDSSGDKERWAAKMYFMGIAHLKDVFDEKRETVNFSLTRRWIQSIFNHLLDSESFLYGLTNIKNFDEYTLNHSVNVSVLSVALGRRLGLGRRELTELGLSAFFHDLGKIDIPKEILDKPGKLDPDEWTIMDRHSRFGALRLIRLKIERGIPSRAVLVAFEHHLKADPAGLLKLKQKKHINLYSRIVKITDYFDALTTKRVYRPHAYTREEALTIMIRMSSDEFDPLLLKAFVSMIGAYPVGSLVALDTGEIGVVLEANPLAAFAQRPKVKLITDASGEKRDGEEVDLAETRPGSERFKWTIVKTLDPEKYRIRTADYFLARFA